jgi:ABC-type Co2+ transport system permease subunit
MMIDPLFLGIGSAVIAVVLTFLMPVSPHRVNQTLISIVIALLVFVAAFAIFDMPLAIIVGVAGTIAAIIYRDIMRWIKEFMWHNVFRYTHRYYWYNRVGRAIIGGGRRRGRNSS